MKNKNRKARKKSRKTVLYMTVSKISCEIQKKKKNQRIRET